MKTLKTALKKEHSPDVRATVPSVGIRVTEKQIATAIPKNSHHCMIADAVKVAIPEATNIYVDVQSIRYTDRKGRRRYVYLTPKLAQHAILAFDQGQKNKLKPFEFRIAQGYSKPMGWQAQHRTITPNPKWTRDRAKRIKAGTVKRGGNPYAVRAERQFGLCMMSN